MEAFAPASYSYLSMRTCVEGARQRAVISSVAVEPGSISPVVRVLALRFMCVFLQDRIRAA